jgi:ubiquinone/menaquinone biosynthesis C-methylase UbiE
MPVSVWESKETAADWDDSAPQLATRAEQQEILLTLMTASSVDSGTVLDLGIGSGLVAEAVLETFPRADLVGVDLSEPMLELARRRLERFGSRVRLLRHDLARLDALALQHSAFRVVFAVQTLHHLSDSEKAAALAHIASLLEPGGVVVIVDRVAVPQLLFEQWAAVWHRLDAGTTPESYADYLAGLEAGGDRPSTLEEHLAWLREADLESACLHAYGNRAVMVGRKRVV